ncbi:YheC/YheD family protein [Evansella sp. LMS18]|jgi:hypothetical protein|uniref:YheC/YheD family endospore coat-associated protein n=1 Tax=Evansella sp. LMS18 TaxID=2924033 RepID=UPI0020D0D1C0|nr:YheC/YheD family protein [Evansella sp. LMS18]UTR11456.1 YheC/YheD family protein [Evansella sp. LMS18]
MDNTKYAGILVSPRTFRKIPHMSGRLSKVVSLYEKAAKRNNIKICFLRASKIDFESLTAEAYIKYGKEYKLTTVDLPEVVFRRTSYSKKYKRDFEKLCNSGRLFMFNLRRFKHKKYKDYKFLKKNAELRGHLPETKKATVRTIRRMMRNYSELLIKPDSGAVGKGIMKLEKTGSHWTLHYKKRTQDGLVWKTKEFDKEFPDVLTEKIKKRTYIVQERIDLATVNGAPFDMRVSVQKNGSGNWQVSGIIVKLGEKGHFLTNIHQGGTSFTLTQLLAGHSSLPAKKIKADVSSFALRMAEYIGTNYPFMGDLGFDIGLSKDGFPYFIELNTVSDYPALTLRNNKLVVKEWQAVFTTPLDYAAYLLRRNYNNM